MLNLQKIPLPNRNEIPEDFWNDNDNSKLLHGWSKDSHNRLTTIILIEIKWLLDDLSSEHNHKMAGVAFLLSQYFDDVVFGKETQKFIKTQKTNIQPKQPKKPGSKSLFIQMKNMKR